MISWNVPIWLKKRKKNQQNLLSFSHTMLFRKLTYALKPPNNCLLRFHFTRFIFTVHLNSQLTNFQHACWYKFVYFYHLIRWSHLWYVNEMKNWSESVQEAISMWIKLAIFYSVIDALELHQWMYFKLNIYVCFGTSKLWILRTRFRMFTKISVRNPLDTVRLANVKETTLVFFTSIPFVRYVTHSKSNNRDLITIEYSILNIVWVKRKRRECREQNRF